MPDRRHLPLDVSGLPVEPVQPPDRCPQRRGGRDRRHGLRRTQPVRRTLPPADRRPARRQRAALQPVPRHGPVLAHPPGPDDRPQPPLGRHGRHLGDGHEPPRLLRLPAGQRRDARADPAAATGGARPPSASGTRPRRSEVTAVRSVHPVADRRGLRHLLRLHGRRDEPLVPAALLRHHPGRARPAAGGGLPPDRGPRRPRRRLGAHPAVADPVPAVLHLPRPRRHACAVPRRAPSGSSATRAASTHGWDAHARADPRAPEASSASSRPTPSWPRGPTACRTGTSSTTPPSAWPSG